MRGIKNKFFEDLCLTILKSFETIIWGFEAGDLWKKHNFFGANMGLSMKLMKLEKPDGNNNRSYAIVLLFCRWWGRLPYAFDFWREKLARILSEKQTGVLRFLVRINIIFTFHFKAKMMRFLFILSVVLTVYCSTADRFQKRQEDINNERLGLGVAHAFANKQQEEMLATGRRWITGQC